MSDIAFILTSTFHSKYLPSLLAEHNLRYPVFGPTSGIATDEDVLLRAKKMMESGTKVFIATGRSPDLLIRNLSVPVITLQYSVISIARAVNTARRMSQNVACFLRYGRVYQSALKYKSVFRDKLIITGFENETDAVKSLEYLQANHIEVVVCAGRGGSFIEKFDFPFQCVRLSFEDNDVLDCVAEAKNILHYTTQNTQRISLMNTVHDNVDCGIIAVGEDGNIIEINNVALNYVSAYHHELIYTSLKDGPFSPLDLLLHNDQHNALITIEDTLFFASPRRITTPDHQTATVITLRSASQLLKSVSSVSNQLYEPIPLTPETQASKEHSKNKLYVKTLQMASRFAQADAPVLLSGPSGSGKSAIARSMHYDGSRADKPFVTVYCSAISSDSADTILFGSTASNDQRVYGKLELANGGTIFFNEIALLPMTTQAKLLQAIQTRELSDIYTNHAVHLDLKIIASSKYNLLQLIRENKFNEALYYNLSALQLYIPALSERKEDIPALLTRFLTEKAQQTKYSVPKITPEAMKYFAQMSYPGNLRQLANIAERLLIMSEGQPVNLALAQMASDSVLSIPEQPLSASGLREEIDSNLIRETLVACGGKRSLAAQRLGISTTTLWRKIKKYNLHI